MRSQHLTHAVLASLLWCAVVFAFVGMNFMKFESASRALRDSRIETALTELQRAMQTDMDKGTSLSGIEKAEDRLFHYASENDDVLSVMVFAAGSGKILFSTVAAQVGMTVPSAWREKCGLPGTVFVETAENKETVGLPILNAFLETEGCLAAEYKTGTNEEIREKMIATAFHFAFRLALIGVAACFLICFFKTISAFVFGGKKIRSAAVLILCTGVLFLMLQLNFSAMFRAFEQDLRQETAAKTQTIARQVKNLIERVVRGGEPFKSINGLEAYLDQIRQKNKEILFILVTDKTGRVLYESGAAAKAFDADPRTGKISLREGYYNAAEPVNDLESAAGWVQIGVNERFAREKIF